MTRLFARIDQNVVAEIVPPLPLSDGWLEMMPEDGDVRVLFGYPSDVWVEITGIDPMPQPNWAYVDAVFTEPQAHVPSKDEIIKENTARQDALQIMASQVMTPLLVSLQLGDATDEEKNRAKGWQTFSRELRLVDLSQENPRWPSVPE